jgi:hypothetical protein
MDDKRQTHTAYGIHRVKHDNLSDLVCILAFLKKKSMASLNAVLASCESNFMAFVFNNGGI